MTKMTINQKIDVISGVQASLKLAYDKGLLSHDISLTVPIQFNIRGRVTGQATYHRYTHSCTLRFNESAITAHWDELFNDTIPHEVAHVVCMLNNKLGTGHDAGWKRVCRQLGGTSNRCHSLDLPAGKRRPDHYVYNTCGEEYAISPIRHARLQRNTHTYLYTPVRGRVATAIERTDWTGRTIPADQVAALLAKR